MCKRGQRKKDLLSFLSSWSQAGLTTIERLNPNLLSSDDHSNTQRTQTPAYIKPRVKALQPVVLHSMLFEDVRYAFGIFEYTYLTIPGEEFSTLRYRQPMVKFYLLVY